MQDVHRLAELSWFGMNVPNKWTSMDKRFYTMKQKRAMNIFNKDVFIKLQTKIDPFFMQADNEEIKFDWSALPMAEDEANPDA